MIIGLGVDVVELDRIQKSWSRFGTQFSGRILTPFEQENMPKSPESRAVSYLAARFAAKEAASKALGTGLAQGVTFQGIEVRPQESGKPELFFLGKTLDLSKAMGANNLFISLTHGRDVAVAVVVLEK